MFSGRFMSKGEKLAPGDTIIPLSDYNDHNPHYYHENDFFFNYYGWICDSFQGMHEESKNPQAWAPGTGAALNCMLPLVNIIARDDKIKFSDSDLKRGSDAGAGAFTPFHDRYNLAYRNIEPGEELFDSYGEGYFTEREEIYGKIPLFKDFDQADGFLDKYVDLRNEICEESSNCNSLHNEWYSFMANLTSVWPSRTLNALPTDPQVVDEIAEIGTSWRDYNRSIRDMDWLKDNGSCMDNLISKESTVPQAGRGAFARRHIAAGDVVGPAPCVHMVRDEMNMYETYFDENGHYKINVTGNVVHQQLVLNYCFGHDQSTVLLCPYGMLGNLINHSRERANAKIQWNWDLMQHPEWLDLPPSEWVHDLSAGIVFDYTATRDIEVGEEVLIDYGASWVNAWTKFVDNWSPAVDAETYIPARELNKLEVIRTVREGGHPETYTWLLCRDIYRQWSLLDIDPEADMSYRLWSGHLPNEGRVAHHCRAIDRHEQNGETMYTYTRE
jgi:hypothetical protein